MAVYACPCYRMLLYVMIDHSISVLSCVCGLMWTCFAKNIMPFPQLCARTKTSSYKAHILECVCMYNTYTQCIAHSVMYGQLLCFSLRVPVYVCVHRTVHATYVALVCFPPTAAGFISCLHSVVSRGSRGQPPAAGTRGEIAIHIDLVFVRPWNRRGSLLCYW